MWYRARQGGTSGVMRVNNQITGQEPTDSGETKVVFRLCPNCGHNNEGSEKNTSYCPEFWRMTACSVCGFVYLEKSVSYEELHSDMAWEKTSKIEDRRREESQPISRKASALTRKRLHLLPRKNAAVLVERYARPGRVVDLGCADGAQSEGLSERFVPIGIEISAQLAQKGNAAFEKRGGHVINAPCLVGLKTFPDDHFSAATLRAYLEHELKPKEVLIELFRCMEKNGIAVVKVPNYASVNRMVRGSHWCGFRFPDHLNYFTPSSLKRMVLDCGFKIRRFHLIDRLPTSDNMWMIIEK